MTIEHEPDYPRRDDQEWDAPDDHGLYTIKLPSAAGRRADSMTVRLADCDGERSKANMLIDRMYSWRGYGKGHTVAVEPNAVTFTATSGGELIGTLTLTVDSKAGLATDHTFGDELDRFRQGPGARLCELTKFAFDASTPARPRLAGLFHIIFIYGTMRYACTDLFIEVNPRHARFYQAMLGFTCIGETRMNEAVAAPSRLMWLNVAEIRRRIGDRAGTTDTGDRSLYTHFFSRKEEEGIYGRLTRLSKQSAAFKSAGQDHIPAARPGSRERRRPN